MVLVQNKVNLKKMENVGITTKSITINLFMKSSSKNQIICFTVGAKFELSGGNKKAQTGENFFKCIIFWGYILFITKFIGL
jgi:hypothetical protein